MPVNIQSLVQRADRQLSALEEQQLQEYFRALRTSHDALLNEFTRRWPDDDDEALTQGGAIGRARADIILQQSNSLVQLVERRLQGLAEGAAASSINGAWQQGVDGALETLRAFDPSAYQSALAALNVQGQIDTRSMTQAMLGMRDNLTNWSSEFISGAQNAVIQSLVGGGHTSTMSRALAEQFATTRYKVNRVLRTELHQAQDRARREVYAEANVQYVQRIATQDERVCFWCAERAGHVYRIDEAPASLHPFDRCFNMPWNPIWEEEGLIDNDWVNEHARETKEAYNRQVEARRAAGYTVREPDPGSRAPFDPPSGPPRAIWMPGVGITSFGHEIIAAFPPYMPPRDDDGGAPPPPDEPPPPPPPPSEPPPTPPSAAPTTVSPSQADVTGYLREKDAYMAFQDADLTELSAEDRKLILKYQSWDYEELNSYLRGESTTLEGWTMEEVERLRELVAQDVVPEDMLSFRLFGIQGDKIPDDLSAMIGTTIENPHFVSTSIREDFPNAIIGSRIGEPGEVSVLTTIKVPAGTRGMYADLPFEWIDDPDEWAEMMVDDMPGVMHELILPPGTNFRIVGAEWEYEGSTLRLTVELEQPSFAQTPTFASPEAARQFYHDTLINDGVPAAQAERLARTMAGITDDVVPTVPITPTVQEPVTSDTPISVRDAAPHEWGVSEKSTREWFDYQGEDVYYLLDADGNLEIAQRYTGNGHKEINAALRQGGDIPPHLQAEVSVLDDLFATEEATSPESYTLYRAFSHPTGQIAMDPDKMVGTILHDRGFMSTSYDLDAIDRYFLSTAPKDYSEASFLVEIRTRAGQPAIGMEHISGLHEGEVLLPRGTALQIVESRWVEQPNGEGYWHLITEPTSAPTSEPLFISWKTPASEPNVTTPPPVPEVVIPTPPPPPTPISIPAAVTDTAPILDSAKKREGMQILMYSIGDEDELTELFDDIGHDYDYLFGVNSRATYEEYQEAMRDLYGVARERNITIPSIEEWERKWEEHYRPHMEFLADPSNTAIAIRANAQSAQSILEDGRIYSQFKTNTSGGALDHESRAEAEFNLWGYSPTQTRPEDRPIYGYLTTPDLRDAGSVAEYGDIVFKLKNDVRPRTTFVGQDSLDSFGMAYHYGEDQFAVPSSLTNPNFRSFGRSGELASPPPNSIESVWDFVNYDYIETQIHGGVSLDDIESIMITTWAQKNNTKASLDALVSAAERRGITVIWEQ